MGLWDWYPVFLREMMLFKRRLFKFGYLLSALMVPILYFLVFGLGLGKNVQLSSQDYLTFLVPGLVGMSSMINSYSWIANSVNLGRLYFRTFQILVQAPISFFHVVLGEVFSGMVKGLFAAILILLVGYLTGFKSFFSLTFLTALFLNCFLFASLGFVVGLVSKGHEETASYSNFFILPMAFFCGTFFPLENLPFFIKPLIYILPLTHTNILIRKSSFDSEAWLSLLILILYSGLLFFLGIRLMRNYTE